MFPTPTDGGEVHIQKTLLAGHVLDERVEASGDVVGHLGCGVPFGPKLTGDAVECSQDLLRTEIDCQTPAHVRCDVGAKRPGVKIGEEIHRVRGFGHGLVEAEGC